jgi:hypothetical protein
LVALSQRTTSGHPVRKRRRFVPARLSAGYERTVAWKPEVLEQGGLGEPASGV